MEKTSNTMIFAALIGAVIGTAEGSGPLNAESSPESSEYCEIGNQSYDEIFADAKSGNTDAQYNLGCMYYFSSVSVPKGDLKDFD